MRFPFRCLDGIYVVLKTVEFFAIISVTVLRSVRSFGRARYREGLEISLRLFRTPCSPHASGVIHTTFHDEGRKHSLAPNLFTDVLFVHV